MKDQADTVWTSLQTIADDLDVSVDDVRTVADIELGLDMYDPDGEQVNDTGAKLLVSHFRGGVDPEK